MNKFFATLASFFLFISSSLHAQDNSAARCTSLSNGFLSLSEIDTEQAVAACELAVEKAYTPHVAFAYGRALSSAGNW